MITQYLFTLTGSFSVSSIGVKTLLFVEILLTMESDNMDYVFL